jgi:ADP-ribosylglycohydrolase
MRAGPIGVQYPSSRLDDLVRGAFECAIPTHGGQLAICAAAAVAAAVSAALEGLPGAEVLAVSLRASKEAEALRPSAEEIRRPPGGGR